MKYTYYESEITKLLILGDSTGIFQIVFENSFDEIDLTNYEEDKEVFKDLIAQLDRYFAGELKTFDVKLNPKGSDFQKEVWNQLSKIPYGETISYKELANRVGREKAHRAVGTANGKNPFPVVIPCHRVINESGKLGGFGGGLDLKSKLLELEGIKL